ncbi:MULTISPECIES: response regulator transcription factor [Streptomyces]|uniref:Response regulator transcription factor n=1 Tax=Streptomyces griseiscabiei TaxID=2993540 RepID=A0ABU4L4B1_9ACTN|nr:MULTISPECIES: response regulator transcription factor [Streptomyces]MBZ3905356.1 response regulator transcription factor [Streptomyces griseiscabiei]MDX2910443.1 response regulator transcription factor [Streptomyces griseiscabiei]
MPLATNTDPTPDKPPLPRGTGQHVLIAADDPSTAELLSTTLELAGYHPHTTPTGREAVARLTDHRFDLVVLDLALPDLEDLGRERHPVAHRPPVLFLTQYDSLGKLLPELGLGEQDYVTKPFRVAEVLARAQVLLRGRKPVRRDGELSYCDLVLDDPACQALRAGRALNLTPAEYRLLRYLLVNAHKVLSKEQIGRYVWGDFHGDNAIEQLVSRLRRKVDREGPPLIHTRRGFGYRLGTAAERSEANSP